MKYTVVIPQSVPPELRADLAERLSTRFGLSPDQAQKLAARKPGRLLKPTTRARADTLLSLYLAMNLPATLEEVADEEDAASTPAAPASTPGTPGAVTASPTAPAPQASAAVATRPSVTPDAPTVTTATTATWDEVALTPPVTAPAVASLVKDAPATSTPVAATSSEPAPTPAPAPVRPSVTPTLERTFADEMPVTEEAKPTRRFSLRQRVLVTTLTPLVIASLSLLAGSYAALQQAQQQVIRDGAQALAASVGTSVNIDDVNALDTQLRTLLKQPSVGFIAVNTPDGLQFFRSKTEEADFLLGETVNGWIAKHPDASSFVNADRPAQRYEVQLQQLKESGVSDPALLKNVQAKIDDPANRKETVTNYEIQNIGVYQRDGVRFAGPAKPAEGAKDQPRFTVAVGVISDSSVRVTQQSTLLLFGLTLVILVTAALFAVRTGRRIVQPIETLVQAADKISLGQLDTPVAVERNDEIGDLARALERMRLSLEAAMERLRKRRSRG